jgi:hypothetical protein
MTALYATPNGGPGPGAPGDSFNSPFGLVGSSPRWHASAVTVTVAACAPLAAAIRTSSHPTVVSRSTRVVSRR